MSCTNMSINRLLNTFTAKLWRIRAIPKSIWESWTIKHITHIIHHACPIQQYNRWSYTIHNWHIKYPNVPATGQCIGRRINGYPSIQ